ncbi:malonate--CoA ligase [Algicella marina]|uniref:AMP-binding protein n=1 Tax=Algicella marina TaxID=2683284 RepID=A0A6P1T0K2_9RHOB|nr:malonyl-CoA synthase [Algicella marina]QHQ35527.1 AMP-binding protein [Algicella marina]
MTNPLYDSLFGVHAGKESVFLHLADAQTLTHAEFVTRAAQFAHALTELGAVAGDRVAMQVEKCADALAVYAACVQAGLIFLPLNTAYTGDELGYFIANSGARVFVCEAARLEELQSAAGEPTRLIALSGAASLAELADRAPTTFKTVARQPDDLAAFLYTSGTTGRSKGAMLSQRNLLSNSQVLVDYWRFTEDDVLLHALPIFHTHGLFVATNVSLLAGGSMIFLPKFDINEMIRLMPQATTMMGVPTFYTRLLGDPRFDGDLTGHMRLFVSGSAPLLSETHVQFEERTGHRILERYGMTETNMNTSNPYEGERRAGTVGLPLPGVELKITDPASGKTLAEGEIGQIEVRGDNVFQGYWQMPEKTAEELRADGFFITGDLGRIGPDGYVEIVGRNKDLIISGGYNIYPKEIETVLDESPDVLESAVIGVPHADFGESVVAVLVPAAGTAPDIEALDALISTRLARFKHPRRYELLDALPRNAMGKVQKAALRQKFS